MEPTGSDVPITTTTCSTTPNDGYYSLTIQSPTPITAWYYWDNRDTSTTVANALMAGLNASGSSVNAVSNSNGTITITSNQTGINTNYPVSYFSSVPAYGNNNGIISHDQTSTLALTGGWTAGTFYDTGTLTAEVSGTEVQLQWGQNSTNAGLASNLAAAINGMEGISGSSCPTANQINAINSDSGGFVTACATGSTVTLTSLNAGPEADWSVTASMADTNPTYFSAPSFSVASTNMNNGALAADLSATASFTFSGTEQSVSTSGSTSTYSTATLTFSGTEQSMTSGSTVTYDAGGLVALIFINGPNSAPCQSSAVYGSGSTPASLATALASSINNLCSAGVSATASGAVVTLTSTTPGAASNYGIAIAGGHNTAFSSWSFTLTPSGSAMTGGGGTTPVTTYDSGSYQVAVSSGQGSCAPSVPYGQGSTPASLASTLAANINSSCASLVTASASGAAVTVTSLRAGAASDYGILASMTGGISSTFPNGSFTLTPSGSSMTGGIGYGAMFYSYQVPPGGYAPTATCSASPTPSPAHGITPTTISIG